jgi:TolA-binding protein
MDFDPVRQHEGVVNMWSTPALRLSLVMALGGAGLAPAAGGGPARGGEEVESAAKSPTEREAELKFNQAGLLYRQKSWREAAAAFAEYLKRFPKERDAEEARFALGYSLNRLGDHAGAVESLRLVAASSEAAWAPDARFYLGRSLEALAEALPEGSDERRARSLEAAKCYGEAAALRLKAKPRAGEGPEAVVEFEALALTSQAEALYDAGSYEGAARAVERLFLDEARFRGSSQYARGLYVLALSRHKQVEAGRGDPAAAFAVFARLTREDLEKDELWPDAAFTYAKLLHRAGERARAGDLYQRVAERRGKHAEEAAYYRAVALYEAAVEAPEEGRKDAFETAGEGFTGFLRSYPEHSRAAEARFHEALCFFERERYAEAAARFEQVIDKGGDLAGVAWLRLGQCHLLAPEEDAAAARSALEKAVEALSREPAGPVAAAAEQLAEAIYWRGEACLAAGGASLEAAARDFREVAEKHAAIVPSLAEKALYQEARAAFLDGDHRAAARAAARYREKFPPESGRYHADSLQLSAENALRAEPGDLDEDERQSAARYFAEAAALEKDRGAAVRLRYRSGVASYYRGDFAAAAVMLEMVRAEAAAGNGELKEPDLSFFLADSLAQKPRAEPLAAPDRERLERAAGLFTEYLAGQGSGAHAATALVNLGLSRKWLGDHAGAKRSFSTFLEGYPGHPSAPEVRFELASAHVSLGELEAAADEYRLAARVAGEGPERDLLAARALLQAASLERRLARPARALEALAELEEIEARAGAAFAGSPEGRALLVESDYQRAAALVEVGDAKRASEAFAAHLEKFPSSPYAARARVQLAHLRLDAGQASAALEAVAPLLDASPPPSEQDQALYLSAWCHSSLAEAGEAGEGDGGDPAGTSARERARSEMEAAYRRLIAEHPASDLAPDAMLELGQHLFNRKAYAEARKHFAAVEAAVTERTPRGGAASERLAPLLEASRFSLAFVAFEEKKFTEARDLFDRVAAGGDPERVPRALFQGGRSYMLSGGEKEAAERFRRYVERTAPKAGEHREEVLLRLGECLNRLETYDEAAGALRKMLEEYPEGELRHEGRFALGFALQFADRPEEAIAVFRRVVAETRSVVAARSQYHVGECLMDEGKHREAAREFLTVVANFDFEGAYQDWVRRALLASGLAYEAAGDAEAARTQFAELVRRFPESEEGKAAGEKLSKGDG